MRTRPPVTANPSAPAAHSHAAAPTLTHPDRVYWPDVELTKAGLAQYYTDVWPWIAPHIVARPLALVRCPGGVGSHCFFQKEVWSGLPSNVAVLPNDGPGGDHFLAIDGLDGLIALVQAGVLEIHPWGAAARDLAHPDRLIFDLDPGPRLDFSALVEAAREVRERLRRDGLESFVKTSGGKGLHVVAPLAPRADWERAKAYAKGIAEAMASEAPDRYTVTVAKVAREHRIFIDYLRNARGATAVAAYSTRARPGAPVSAPLRWDELGPYLRGNTFTVGNIRQRLASLGGDPWAGFFTLEQTFPGAPARRGVRAKAE